MNQTWDHGHYLLARALLAKDDDGSSLEVCAMLDQCLTLNPDHEEAKQILADQWKAALPSKRTVTPLGNWQANKEAAEKHYQEGNYEIALAYYQQALSSDFQARPPSETPAILCGSVECRLKLGGSKHAETAIAEAKQVSLDVFAN